MFSVTVSMTQYFKVYSFMCMCKFLRDKTINTELADMGKFDCVGASRRDETTKAYLMKCRQLLQV